jgi:hypothetical protein
MADRVKHGDLRIEYCPTGDMVADFFTIPLQGSLFQKLCQIFLNLPDEFTMHVEKSASGSKRELTEFLKIPVFTLL